MDQNPTNPTLDQTDSNTLMRNQGVSNTKTPVKYIKSLNTHKRVDIVLSELYEKHQWMIKDLIYYIVTAGLIKKNSVLSLV
jgi:hypothetical protein